MNLKGFLLAIATLLTTFVATGYSFAAPVTCGDATLGTRVVTVYPAKDGGLCFAQNGNFIGDDFSVLAPSGETVTLIRKNEDWGTEFVGGSLLGTWSFDSVTWDTYDSLYLAFHFGNGGTCKNPTLPCEKDPDSFIVELEENASNGTWMAEWGTKWGLSNLYLVGLCDGECGEIEVPEPSSFALFALGLGGLFFARRKYKA